MDYVSMPSGLVLPSRFAEFEIGRQRRPKAMELTPARVLETIGMKVGELDMISGGPPCQGFSKAGLQNVMYPRNSLVFDWLRFAVEMQPKAVLMEEVPEIATMVTPDGDNVLDRVIRILSDGGFGGVDALKKSVDAKAGSMGIIRGRARKPAPAKAARKATPKPPMPKPRAAVKPSISKPVPAQPDLFGEPV